jgi:hypothetical protein
VTVLVPGGTFAAPARRITALEFDAATFMVVRTQYNDDPSSFNLQLYQFVMYMPLSSSDQLPLASNALSPDFSFTYGSTTYTQASLVTYYENLGYTDGVYDGHYAVADGIVHALTVGPSLSTTCAGVIDTGSTYTFGIVGARVWNSTTPELFPWTPKVAPDVATITLNSEVFTATFSSHICNDGPTATSSGDRYLSYDWYTLSVT